LTRYGHQVCVWSQGVLQRARRAGLAAIGEHRLNDPSRERDSKRETGIGPDRGAPPGVPGWVMVSGAIVAILVAALVVVALVGGQNHGPGRHTFGDLPTEQSRQTAFGEGTSSHDDARDWALG
jgi:hypothetical protein